jgi:hypothetical protein
MRDMSHCHNLHTTCHDLPVLRIPTGKARIRCQARNIALAPSFTWVSERRKRDSAANNASRLRLA